MTVQEFFSSFPLAEQARYMIAMTQAKRAESPSINEAILLVINQQLNMSTKVDVLSPGVQSLMGGLVANQILTQASVDKIIADETERRESIPQEPILGIDVIIGGE